jgi:hypothetical protein
VRRIRFGLSLDGERGWHAHDSLGHSTVGPLGFLNVLEAQLGLTGPSVSASEGWCSGAPALRPVVPAPDSTNGAFRPMSWVPQPHSCSGAIGGSNAVGRALPRAALRGSQI